MFRPRVFVSSVIDDFHDYREAARRGIASGGAEPVMVEDFSPSATSPRNACLDGVASCDAIAIIIGQRGGWKTPSGKLAVEEEYDEAKRLHKQICAFVQDGPKDPEATQLAAKISDYVTGHFRSAFTTSDDLEKRVRDLLPEALHPLTLHGMRPEDISERLTLPVATEAPAARLVLAPERMEEVIDRLRIGEDEFIDDVMRHLQDPATHFFDVRSKKEVALSGDILIVSEVRGDRRGSEAGHRLLEVAPSGILRFDAWIGKGEKSSTDMSDYFQLSRYELELAFAMMFRSAAALFDWLDTYGRHQRFAYGAAVIDIGFRSLVDTFIQQSGGSMARQLEGPLVVEERRLIGRSDLRSSDGEVNRISKLLKRRMDDAS